MNRTINDFFNSDKLGLRLFQNSAMPCIVMDKACDNLFVNTLFCTWIKYPALKKQPDQPTTCPPDLQQWFCDHIKPGINHPQGDDHELKFTNWHGEEIWAEIFETPVPCTITGTQCRFIQFRDITNRHHQIETSQRVDTKLRMLFESMNEAFALHKIITNEHNEPIDYVYLDVNQAFERMTGFTREQIIGHHLLELMPKTEPYWIHEFGKVALEGGTAELVNYAQELNRYYEVKVYSPEPGHFAVMFTDITQRMETEKALKDSEAHHRFLTDNIMDVIWVYDIETDRFTYVSPSVKKLRNYTPEEVMTQSLFETFPPTSLEIIKNALPREVKKFKLGNPGIFKEELEQYCKDGSIVWIEVIAYLRQNETNNHLEVIGTSRNITDRHRAEIARQEIENRYRILTEVTTEGIIIHHNGTIIDVNPSLVRMLGIPIEPAQMVGKSIFVIFPQGEAEAELVRQHIENNFLGTYQINMHRFDGSLFPAEVLVKSIEINGVSHRVASINDITQRKEAEKQIIESEARFRSIFDNAIAGIVFVSVDGSLLMMNKAFCDIVGYQHHELEGKTFYDITHPDDIKQETDLIDDAIESGSDHFRFEKRYINKQQQTIWTDLSASILRDATGKPYSMVAVVNDITLKKQNEQALLQTLEYNKNINLTSPVGIITTDADGEIIFANHLAASILGLSLSELAGRKYNSPSFAIEALDGGAFDTSELSFCKVKKTLNPVYDERHAIRWPDGRRVCLSVNASPLLTNDGVFNGMIATIEDITNKLEVEKQLHQSNKELHELNQTKDRFFSIIAHDLRGSLGNITNLSELLYAGFKTKEMQIDEEIVKTIYDSSLSTLNLLENLLAWANSQRHTTSVKHEKVALSSIIHDSVMVLEAIALEKSIDLAFNLDDAIVINTDRAMLSTIVRNLVSNAIKYSFANSQITITSRITHQPHLIEIGISDKGIGMDATTLATLFETDRQQSAQGTAGEQGTGLGLLLCRELVEKLNGTIRVESEQGNGSRFFINLPKQ